VTLVDKGEELRKPPQSNLILNGLEYPGKCYTVGKLVITGPQKCIIFFLNLAPFFKMVANMADFMQKYVISYNACYIEAIL